MPAPHLRPAPSRFPGKALLRIGDTPAASVESFAGGEPYAAVVTEPGGLLPYAKKHLGELQFADLEAQVAMDAHPALFRWVRDAWFGSPARERVAVDASGAGGALPRTIELAHARLREVVLPALDVSSLDRRFMRLRIAPRGVRRVEPSSMPPLGRSERDFLARNFSVSIDGLDCNGVVAVDSFSVQSKLPETGGRALLVFPDIHLWVDEEKADPFREWFEDFVIAGNNDDDRERSGSVSYLDPLLTEPLAVLQLHHVGIYRIADEPPGATRGRRVRVDLYCERMELTASGAGSGDTQEGEPVRA